MYNINKIFEEIKVQMQTPKEVAKAIGVSESNFTAWKKGRNKPSDKMMEKIAMHLNLDVEYFYDTEPGPVPKRIASRLVEISRDFGSVSGLLEKCDIDFSRYTALSDGYMIDMEDLEKIARIAHVSLDYVLCNTNNKYRNEPAVLYGEQPASDAMKQLLETVQDFNETEAGKMHEYALFLISQRKQ